MRPLCMQTIKLASRGVEVMKLPSVAVVVSGSSSGMECPAGKAAPLTVPAHCACHSTSCVAGGVPALRATLAVVLPVDIGTGPVVFAGAVNGLGAAKAALVFDQRLRLHMGQTRGALRPAPAAELGVQIGA